MNECRKKAFDKKTADKTDDVCMITEELQTLWVMGVECAGARADAGGDFVWVSIDSGSDADGCPNTFGHETDNADNPTRVTLRTATGSNIRDMGEKASWACISGRRGRRYHGDESVSSW